MRARAACGAVVLLLAAGAARGDEVVPLAGKTASMCRDPKSLADITAPDGQVRHLNLSDMRNPAVAELWHNCKDLPTGSPMEVLSRRHNTSIVRVDGATWYLANIDVMPVGPGCLKDGARISVPGTIEHATATSVRDETTTYRYIRIRLDRPVCWNGNTGALPDATVISLPATSEAAGRRLEGLVGRHVTVTGVVNSPDNGNQPPDPMMMFDPVVSGGPGGGGGR